MFHFCQARELVSLCSQHACAAPSSCRGAVEMHAASRSACGQWRVQRCCHDGAVGLLTEGLPVPREFCSAETSIPEEVLLIWGGQLLSALSHAHQRNILHAEYASSVRKLKPLCQGVTPIKLSCPVHAFACTRLLPALLLSMCRGGAAHAPA